MSRIPRPEALPPWGAQEPSTLKTELLTKQGHGEVPSSPRKAAVRREALTGALPPYHDRESAAAFLKGLREPMDFGDLGHGELPWSGGGLDATLGGRQSQPTGPWDPWGWLESQWGKYGPIEMDRLFGGPPEGDGVGQEDEWNRAARHYANADRTERWAKRTMAQSLENFGEAWEQGHVWLAVLWAYDYAQKKALAESAGKEKKEALEVMDKATDEKKRETSGRHIDLIGWANRKSAKMAMAQLWRKIRTGMVAPEQLDTPTRMALSQALSGITFTPLGTRSPDTGYERIFEAQKKGMEGKWKVPPDKVEMLFAWGNIDPRPT